VVDGAGTEHAQYRKGKRFDLNTGSRRLGGRCVDCQVRWAQGGRAGDRCRRCARAAGLLEGNAQGLSGPRIRAGLCTLCGERPPVADVPDARHCLECLQMQASTRTQRRELVRVTVAPAAPKYREIHVPGEGPRLVEVVWDGAIDRGSLERFMNPAAAAAHGAA
jgi:hypothetical protein